MSSESREVVIVGASAAGLRCAARLKRIQPKWSITVVEQGKKFSLAACGMPYVLSGDVANAPALLMTGDGVVRDEDYFEDVKAVEVLSRCRALSIDSEKKTLLVEDGSGQKELPYDDLVLASGARSRKLPGQPDHPRVHAFHSYGDLIALNQGLKQGQIKKVILVGAGLVGCELAEAFRTMWDAQVVLLEAAARPLPMLLDPATSGIVAQELRAQGVDVQCSMMVSQIEADDQGVKVTAGGKVFDGDAVVVSFGLQPAVELAQTAGIDLGPTGAIVTDDRLATSVEHIWAAGDCIQVTDAVTSEPAYRPLGSLANRQGRTLANILGGKKGSFPAVAGATAVKVFGQNVATVGMTLERALGAYPQAQAVWMSPHDRAHYWPETKDIFIQLVFDGSSRRVLGVQVVGPGECAKRVDVATGLIARGSTLDDFTQLEHAYAPPYAPALEPLAQAAMLAENMLDGLVGESPMAESVLDQGKILDVRHDYEWSVLPIPVSDVTTIDQLDVADSLDELRADVWTVVCHRGTRSFEVARFLLNQGIKASYLAGGTAWLQAMGSLSQKKD